MTHTHGSPSSSSDLRAEGREPLAPGRCDVTTGEDLKLLQNRFIYDFHNRKLKKMHPPGDWEESAASPDLQKETFLSPEEVSFMASSKQNPDFGWNMCSLFTATLKNVSWLPLLEKKNKKQWLIFDTIFQYISRMMQCINCEGDLCRARLTTSDFSFCSE